MYSFVSFLSTVLVAAFEGTGRVELSASQLLLHEGYAYCWGTSLPESHLDRSILLEGYNSGFIENSSSTKTSFPWGDSNSMEGMMVKLTHLALLSNDGSRSDLLEGGDGIRECVSPSSSHILCLPKTYRNSLIPSLGGVRLNNTIGDIKSSVPYYHSTSIDPTSA